MVDDRFTGIGISIVNDGEIHTVHGFNFKWNKTINSDSALIDITGWGHTHTITVHQGTFQSLTNPYDDNDILNWYTSSIGYRGAYLWVKDYYPSTANLVIDKVITELSPAGDLPKYNRYGVYLEIHVSGIGKGLLKIDWGTDHSETKTGIIAGNYAYVYNLPPGTHSVCAGLFSVV